MPALGHFIHNPSTGAFSVVKCSVCTSINTHHQCLAWVTTGGFRFGSSEELVCSSAICGPCSASFGNENVTRCQLHSSKGNSKKHGNKENFNKVSNSSSSKATGNLVRFKSVRSEHPTQYGQTTFAGV
jgi:hypothetical protein